MTRDADNTPDTRAVVLLSGGLDSAVVLALARHVDQAECHCVSFDYGQRHRTELDAAAQIASTLGAASHRVIRVDLRAIGGSALTADIAVPKDRPIAHHVDPGVTPSVDDIPITYVPARNLIFLSLASALAETLGADRVYCGVNAVDYSGYPDCRPEFIAAFEKAATLATRAGAGGSRLSVHAPLATLSKADIVRLGTRLGVDFGATHSCYDPTTDGLACGHCDSCLIRRRAFVEAAIPDPTRYAESSTHHGAIA